MVITHTQDRNGNVRIYLGGKSSLECWIEPQGKDGAWQFKCDQAVSGNFIAPSGQREYASHLLLRLARKLCVAPADLADVPFEAIAALHDANPFESRRVAMPRRKQIEHGFMATAPHIQRPSSDFTSEDYPRRRQR